MDSTILGATIGLVGVMIGTVLTHWTAYWRERRLTKIKFKPELVELIYIFFNYRKSQFNDINHLLWTGRFLAFKKIELNQCHDEARAKDLSLEVSLLLNDLENIRDSNDETFHRLVELESKMMSMVAQSMDLFGSSTYAKLDNIIRPIIESSNKQQNMYEYDSLTIEEVNALKTHLSEKIQNKHAELNKECDKLLTKVLTTF